MASRTDKHAGQGNGSNAGGTDKVAVAVAVVVAMAVAVGLAVVYTCCRGCGCVHEKTKQAWQIRGWGSRAGGTGRAGRGQGRQRKQGR